MRAILSVVLALAAVAAVAGAPTPGNPCAAVCTAQPGAASGAACALCCRTARHRIPWNCPESRGALRGDQFVTRDTHGGRPAACCSAATWTSACWDTPSPDNYAHSCDRCGPATPNNEYTPQATGCDRRWTTSACWSLGVAPGNQATPNEAVFLNEGTGVVTVPAGHQSGTADNQNFDVPFVWSTLYLYAGTTLALEPGARLSQYQVLVFGGFAEGPVAPRVVVCLGSGLQFEARVTSFRPELSGDRALHVAVRDAVVDLGTVDYNAPMGGLLYLNADADPTAPTKPYPFGAAALAPIAPRYHGTLKLSLLEEGWVDGGVFAAGDSGLVNVQLNATGRFPFRARLEVDGQSRDGSVPTVPGSGPKLLVTGQSAALRSFGTPGGMRYSGAGGWSDAVFTAPARVTVRNGAQLTFGNGSVLTNTRVFVDDLDLGRPGAAPSVVELLAGATVRDTAVDLRTNRTATNTSYVVVDGATVTGASLVTPQYSCAVPCTSFGLGGVCQPVDRTCRDANCAGACTCPGGAASTATLFVAPYSPAAGCSQTAPCLAPGYACLGGSTCVGRNRCSLDCPAQSGAGTFNTSSCQQQLLTCAPACPYGLCVAPAAANGNAGVCTCPATNRTAYFSSDCRTRVACSPVCASDAVCTAQGTCYSNPCTAAPNRFGPLCRTFVGPAAALPADAIPALATLADTFSTRLTLSLRGPLHNYAAQGNAVVTPWIVLLIHDVLTSSTSAASTSVADDAVRVWAVVSPDLASAALINVTLDVVGRGTADRTFAVRVAGEVAATLTASSGSAVVATSCPPYSSCAAAIGECPACTGGPLRPDDGGGSGALSTGAIVGIAVGGAAALALIGATVWYLCARSKAPTTGTGSTAPTPAPVEMTKPIGV